MRRARPIADRMEAQSIPEPNSGCLLWVGPVSRRGYGKIQLPGGKVWAAHRLSYEMHKGTIPPGHYVCHKCDVPGCIEPSHLFVGTPKQNCNDMWSKGRHPRVGYRKRMLDDKTVREIAASALPRVKLAEIYGISPTTVSKYRAVARSFE